MAGPKRFYELDLLRFIAAAAVLLFHYSFRGHAGAEAPSDLDYAYLAPVTKYGYLGVDLFFLISGFVIFMTASNGSPRRFVISRIVRLYPAFWVSCTVSWAVLLGITASRRYVPTVGEYAANMTMVSGFVGVPFVDSVYWSLIVEMKFYFLVFVVLIARQIERAKLLLGLWLVAYLGAKVVKIPFLSALLIPDFAPYFIAGAMFFLISREGVSLYKMLVIVACFALVAFHAVQGLGELDVRYASHFSQVVVVATLAAFFVVFFLIATGRTSAIASGKWVVLGALTYPLYLIHQNIGFALFNALNSRVNPHVLMWGVTALMLLAAYGVTRIEKLVAPPMKDFLSRLLIPKPPPTAAVQGAPQRRLGIDG